MPEAVDGAHAVPAGPFAGDAAHGRGQAARGEQAAHFGRMPGAEAIGLAGQQHLVHRAEPVCRPVEHRIAAAARLMQAITAQHLGQGVPAHGGEALADVGVARHGHPRIAPDEVEHLARRAGAGLHLLQYGLQLLAQGGDALGHAGQAAEGRAELVEQAQVVLRGLRMGDDDVGHEGAQRIHGFAGVFVDVD